MNHVRKLQENEIDQWDQFVSSHPLGSIYHTSSWREVIENVYGSDPHYLIIEDGNGTIKAGLPAFLIKNVFTRTILKSLPCSQSCNPLVSNKEDFDQLISFLWDFINKKKIKYIELKTSESFRYNGNGFGRGLYNYSTYLLDIDRDLKEIESDFHSSCVRRAIKKSCKNGLELFIGNSNDDLKAFYKLYLHMRKDKRLLPQPYKFYSTMLEKLSERNYIDILHAKYQGQIISSIILLKYKDRVTYEYGASRSDMMHLNPSPFLLWEAIKRSKQQGYRKFDFGRTSDEQESLATFKRRWGTKQERLPYYFIPDLSGVDLIRQKSISKKMMSFTMSVSPPIFCQMLGGILYKYLV